MCFSKSLTKVFNSSKELPFDNLSKLILMSDIHRSDNSWADNFAHNQNLFFTALNHYYTKGFTYIEIGDGDELWENRKFSQIHEMHSNIFELMRKFHIRNRLYMLYGNHDIVKRKKKYVSKNLYSYYNSRTEKEEPLFDNIEVNEGLILKNTNTKQQIFVTHGHQVDFLNSTLWPFTRFIIRYFWKPLELHFGFKDPTSPAKNFKKKDLVEKAIIRWVKSNNQMTIVGHTHRPMFPKLGKPPYFNTGSSVHPRCITGIEIENGEITLIKWSVKTKDDGTLYVAKDIIVGPKKLSSF